MKKIAFFNHKGGVSKTTSTFHIGWKLAEQGNKVLLIDADSQCNLSLSILGNDEYESFYEAENKNNIKDAVAPAFRAATKSIEPVDCIKVAGNENLFLLPGSINLSEWEVALGVSFQLSNTFNTMVNLPGAFNFLIEETGKKYDADYILIDMNPSLSAINQALLVSADYFIIPTSPDYFSVAAIKSLSEILPKWENWAKKARNTFSESAYPLPLNTPKFLGYLVSQFNIRDGKPVSKFTDIIDRIQITVKEKLLPGLAEVGMCEKNENYNYNIGLIPNFNTLSPLSQKNNVPVFVLTDEQIGSKGTVLENQRAKILEFNSNFEQIVKTINQNIQEYESSPVTV